MNKMKVALSGLAAAVAVGCCLAGTSARDADGRWALTVPHSPFAGEGPKGDPAKLNEIVAGVDFRSENDFRVPVYNEKGNLLMNPSFESGMRYVRTDKYWRDFLTTEAAHSGRYALRRPERYNSTFPPVNYKVIGTVLKPGTWYTVSCYVKSMIDEPFKPNASYGSWQARGTAGYGNMLRPAVFRPIDGNVTPDAHGWLRVAGSFCTSSNNNGKVAVPVHETVIWANLVDDMLFDDFQLEEGRTATPYRGPSLGFDIASGNLEPYFVNDTETGPLYLTVNGDAGVRATLEISHRDIMERSAMPKRTVEVEMPGSCYLQIPLGNREDFPKGVNGIAVRVTEADGYVYEDYLRFNRFHFADGKAKNRRMQTTSLFSTSWLRKSNCHVSVFRQLMFLGFGGLSYSGSWSDANRNTRADFDFMRRYGLEDYWGNGGVWYTVNWGKEVPDGLPTTWQGKPIRLLESYPPELLKVIEDRMCNQAKTYPYVNFWTMHTEPQGHYKTLMNGRLDEYANLIHAIYTGMKRANPKAVLQPYGAYNMEQLGRGWISAMMTILHEKYPNDDYPVIDVHSYRAFPEHPSLEEDFTAFLDCLKRSGYPNIKVKVGEGSYYFPMMRRSINMMPWTGVSEHDGYSGVVIPGYDLGAGEKIGAALNIRESLVYFKYMDRIHSTCSWNPLYIDSRTPCAWTLANASLLEMLGDADRFIEDVRFSTEGRCYVFSDGHGSTVAAIWNANERFDRGLDEATTLRMEDVDGLEVYDLYANKVKVKGEGEQRMEIPFSGYVVYMRVKNEKREELLKALRAATVDGDADKLPLSCGITLKSGTEAAVRIENPLSREQAFAVRIGGEAERTLTLKAREGVTLKAKLTEELKPGTFATVRLPISFTVGGRTFAQDYTADAIVVPYVAGDTPDWTKIPAAKLPYAHSMHKLSEKPHQPTGPDDCPLVTAAIGWNEKHLFMRLSAKDDKYVHIPFGEHGELYHNWQMFGYDGFQLFFDSFGNAVEKARRGVVGHDFDDFSYEIVSDVASSNAAPHGVCFRRFAPDHQLTFGVSEHKFHHNVVVPEIPVKLNAKDGLVEYEVDFPVYYLKPLKLEADGVSPGLGIEYYDRDERKVFPRIKYTNVSFQDACRNPHTYPQLIFVK